MPSGGITRPRTVTGRRDSATRHARIAAAPSRAAAIEPKGTAASKFISMHLMGCASKQEAHLLGSGPTVDRSRRDEGVYYRRQDYAGLWRRLLASSVDAVVALVVFIGLM